MREEETRAARLVGLSLGALWIAVIALRAFTFTGPEATGVPAGEILARATIGASPMVQAEIQARPQEALGRIR